MVIRALSEPRAHPTPTTSHPWHQGVSKMLSLEAEGFKPESSPGSKCLHTTPSQWGSFSLGAEFCLSLFELKEVSLVFWGGETQGGEPSMSPESLAVVGGGSNRGIQGFLGVFFCFHKMSSSK